MNATMPMQWCESVSTTHKNLIEQFVSLNLIGASMFATRLSLDLINGYWNRYKIRDYDCYFCCKQQPNLQVKVKPACVLLKWNLMLVPNPKWFIVILSTAKGSIKPCLTLPPLPPTPILVCVLGHRHTQHLISAHSYQETFKLGVHPKVHCQFF